MASAGSAGSTQPAQMNWARVALDAFNAKHGSSFTIEPSNVNDETSRAGPEARRLAADAVIAEAAVDGFELEERAYGDPWGWGWSRDD